MFAAEIAQDNSTIAYFLLFFHSYIFHSIPIYRFMI